MKEKLNLKKILFYLSLLPYIIFLVLGIINCVKSSITLHYLDLYELFRPISDFWFDLITNFSLIKISLTLFCTLYPIWYLLDSKQNSQIEIPTNNNLNSKKGYFEITFTFYILTFLPYLFLIYHSIFGFDFGFFHSKMYYGLEAIILILIIGSTIFPVYPIIFFFQIIYTSKRKKTWTRVQKKIVQFLISAIIFFLIISSLFHFLHKQNQTNKSYKNDKVIIEKYLKEKFGENAKNMKIIKSNEITSTYFIKTPLLDHGFSVYFYNDKSNIGNDDFDNTFIKEKNLKTKLIDYVSNKYQIPKNITLDLKIEDMDILSYLNTNDIDTLLQTSKYHISEVFIEQSNWDKEEVIKIIKNLYQKNNIFINSNFVITINEQNYALIYISKTSQKNLITLHFTGYNNGNGFTISDENMTINLSNNNEK